MRLLIILYATITRKRFTREPKLEIEMMRVTFTGLEYAEALGGTWHGLE